MVIKAFGMTKVFALSYGTNFSHLYLPRRRIIMRKLWSRAEMAYAAERFCGSTWVFAYKYCCSVSEQVARWRVPATQRGWTD